MSQEEKDKEEEWENPIDKDKVTENPGTLTYGHTVGGAVIKPEDEGKLKSRALSAMQHQTNTQLNQIKQQIDLLAKQAKDIQDRVEISSWIYQAKVSFEPFINHIYHLYKRNDDEFVLTMIGPKEWGKSFPYKEFVASVRLLADHTWEIVEKA
ncbi:MAG: DUF2452 domain-containing protein [Flavobacteriales bacterium]|nr:DUF2452 domain-containing protein [Flavobacteriales bacterium]